MPRGSGEFPVECDQLAVQRICKPQIGRVIDSQLFSLCESNRFMQLHDGCFYFHAREKHERRYQALAIGGMESNLLQANACQLEGQERRGDKFAIADSFNDFFRVWFTEYESGQS